MLDTNDIYADTSVECEDDKDRFVNEKTNRRKGYDWMKPGELRKRDEMNVNDDVSSYKFIKGNSFCEINKHEDLNLSKVKFLDLYCPFFVSCPVFNSLHDSVLIFTQAVTYGSFRMLVLVIPQLNMTICYILGS